MTYKHTVLDQMLVWRTTVMNRIQAGLHHGLSYELYYHLIYKHPNTEHSSIDFKQCTSPQASCMPHVFHIYSSLI